MNKCPHGVYIPDRMLPSELSDACSICQSIDPRLDIRYGMVDEEIIRPFTLNSLYEQWNATRSQFLHEKLFYVLRRFAKSIFRKNLFTFKNLPPWGEAANDAAGNCFMQLIRFDSSKSAFSTWAHMSIQRDLQDWLTHTIKWRERSIDDPYHPVDVYDTRSSSFDKLYLKEVKDLLTNEERHLFERKAANVTNIDIGIEDGVTEGAVRYRWEAVKQKIKDINSQGHTSSHALFAKELFDRN